MIASHTEMLRALRVRSCAVLVLRRWCTHAGGAEVILPNTKCYRLKSFLHVLQDSLLLFRGEFSISFLNVRGCRGSSVKKEINWLKYMKEPSLRCQVNVWLLISCSQGHWVFVVPVKLVDVASRYKNFYFMPWCVNIGSILCY